MNKNNVNIIQSWRHITSANSLIGWFLLVTEWQQRRVVVSLPLDPPTLGLIGQLKIHSDFFSWGAVMVRHWSVTVLLIIRKRIVWEAVNIFEVKPWNVFLFSAQTCSCSELLPQLHQTSCCFLHVLKFQCELKESSQILTQVIQH